MRSHYVLSPEAQRDLTLIKGYYVEQAGARVARQVLAEIGKSFGFLGASPGAGHRREDLTDEDVRFWSVMSYLIVYDPNTKPIGIARVLHASRDLELLFRTSPPRA